MNSKELEGGEKKDLVGLKARILERGGKLTGGVKAGGTWESWEKKGLKKKNAFWHQGGEKRYLLISIP